MSKSIGRQRDSNSLTQRQKGRKTEVPGFDPNESVFSRATSLLDTAIFCKYIGYIFVPVKSRQERKHLAMQCWISGGGCAKLQFTTHVRPPPQS